LFVVVVGGGGGGWWFWRERQPGCVQFPATLFHAVIMDDARSS